VSASGNPPDGTTEPVAIVGMAVLVPGADSLDAYWSNLVNGVDAITDVPSNRWGPELYDPELAHQPNRLYCRRGGFVDEFAYFDPMTFGVMPASVPEIEPEQLLALRVAAAAIEDAGGMDRLPDRDRVGVILGRLGLSSITNVKFYLRVRLADQMCDFMRELVPELSQDRLDQVRELIGERLGPYHPDAVIGLMPNLTASRVANRLDLRGPSYILDAACASSLIAVDHGIAELVSGRLDMVLAGGVHHNHDITFWAVFNQLRALSRRGEIRPFDAAADGLLIGEGTGIVVLKRLSDAIRDGDRIHAVIRGSGVSGDGRSASLVNPETAGQVLAVRRAWAAAGLDPAAPDALGLLEAHGTGTPVGDAAELATVAEVFGPLRGNSAPVIGSVKSMIGHAMAAAGVAALVKAVLAVSRGVLPPTLHCGNPRPEMARTRFMPIAAPRPWDGPGLRRAAVNTFGFGGINAHLIVEQAPDAPRPRRRRHEPAAPAGPMLVYEPDQIVLLAGPDDAAVARLLDADDHAVRAHGTDWAENRAASTSGDRCRLGIADPTEQRLAAARKVVAAGAPWRGGRDIWFSPRPLLANGTGRIAFVFPGLEAELSHQVNDVAAHFGLGAEAAEFADVDTEDFSGRCIEVMRVGWLLHHALARIGVTPDAVAGHSLGEWTAGLVAGLVDESRLGALSGVMFNPVSQRPDLLNAVIGDGAQAVAGCLAGYPGVFLSHDNAPAQSVVCGPVEQVTRLMQELGTEGVVCRPLPFTTGVHTPYMEPFVERMRAGAEQEGAEDRPARMPVWSALLAAPLPAGAVQRRDVFFRQLVEPVRFRSTVMAMHDAGIRAFVQVGPGQLGSLIHENLRGRDHLVIPAHVHYRSGLAQLQRVATALWVEGYAPDLSALEPAARPKSIPAAATHSMRMRLELGSERITLGEGARDLLDAAGLAAARAAGGAGLAAGATALATLSHLGVPPAVRTEFAALLEDTAGAAVAVVAAAGQRAGHGAPGGRPAARAVQDGASRHKSVLRISLDAMPYLMDHSFNLQPAGWPDMSDFMPVVPATAIVQHMIDAVEAATPGRRAIRVDDARFTRWVIAEPAQDVDIIVKRTAPDQFTVSFGPFARARIQTAAAYPADPPPLWHIDPATERPTPLSPERMYATRVMFHGPRYRGVETVHAVGERSARGRLRVPAPPGALLDSGLQLLGNWGNVTLPTRHVLFPRGFGSIQFFGPPPAEGDTIECVGRMTMIDESKVAADLQFSAGGRVWAVISGCESRRFDSHPRARAVELMPGRNAVALRQPEGWVAAFDYWPDPATQNSFARATLGATSYAEYEREKIATRKGWFLSRLSVKDAVRYLLWDDDDGKEIFPVEISVSQAGDGRPHVQGWAGLTVPAYDVSSAQASHLGVAIARPARPEAAPGAPEVGIGVAEITDSPPSMPPLQLSDRELAAIEAASAADPGSPRALWSARFRAAKEAAAKAQGIGLAEAPRLATVTDATIAVITVAACGRTYHVSHREIRTPEELPARRYVVAWTWGPELGAPL
jgi:acyl transferase domain-containing protein